MDRRWFKIGAGIAAGITTIVGLFYFLVLQYGFIIIDLTGNITCEGTLENPCISYFNIRNPMNNVIDIYSKSQVKLDFVPEIRDYALFIKDNRCSATGSCRCELKDGKLIGYKGWRCIDFTNRTKTRSDVVYNFRFDKYSTYNFMLVGLKNNLEDTIKWGIEVNNSELDPIWYAPISYKNNNITIEFKDKETILGQAILKSHKTYDEILKVTSGKNRTVIWYEFSNFKDIQKDALIGVEFIDMRKEIENKSYTEKFDGNLELMNESKIMIPNQNYLLPIEKSYTFVYQSEKGDWIPYNSKDIPKENIIIGVQTDLGEGEFLDVQLNIFNNKLDRHALVLGTNCGFVTEAPVDDPAGSSTGIDSYTLTTKDTSPSGVNHVKEMGVWIDNATVSETIYLGIYTHDAANNEPNTLIDYVQFEKDENATGWLSAVVDIDISASTIYWIAASHDYTTPNTNTDWATSGLSGLAIDQRQGMPSPYVVLFKDIDGAFAIYAVVEEAAADTCTYTSGNWEVNCADNCVITSNVNLGGNNLTLSGSGIFSVQANITNIDYRFLYSGCEIRTYPGGGFYYY